MPRRSFSAEEIGARLYPLFGAKRLIFSLQEFDGRAGRAASGAHAKRFAGEAVASLPRGYFIQLAGFPKGLEVMVEGRQGMAIEADLDQLVKAVKHGLAANGVVGPDVQKARQAIGSASGVVVAKADADAFFTRMMAPGGERLAQNFADEVAGLLQKMAEAARDNGRRPGGL